MPCLLGIDSGTNSCKAFLFDYDGRVISSCSEEHVVHYPKPTWAEQDPDSWWKTAAYAVKHALKKSGLHSDDVRAVGLDSQREAVVLIDGKGEAISNSIIWLDRRTIPQKKQIMSRLSQQAVLSKTGVPIDYCYSAAKIMWLKEQAPHLFLKAKGILFPKDYLCYKLTGQVATDYSMASRTMLFDIHKLKWDEDICQSLGIYVDLLPPVKGAWEVVGEISADAAEATGLSPATPVVSGGGDRPCEALGAGAVEPGRVNVGTGTGTVMTTPLKEPRIDKEARVDCCCHVVPDTWQYELHLATTGACLRWFRDNLAQEEVERGRKLGGDPYDYLVELASTIQPGSDGLFYYPYPSGAKAPKFNELAKAVFFGLTLSHSKAHFVRAIMEGVAYQYAESMELFATLGIRPERVSAVGGEANSDLWNQMKADIMGLQLQVPEVPDAAALGSAILAGVGAGVYTSVGDAVRRTVRFKKSYAPNPENRHVYNGNLEKYKKLYEHVERGYKVTS